MGMILKIIGGFKRISERIIGKFKSIVDLSLVSGKLKDWRLSLSKTHLECNCRYSTSSGYQLQDPIGDEILRGK